MARRKQADHLRLAEPTVAPVTSRLLTDVRARKTFEPLTQELVDIAIEITDLLNGDPDLEGNGDEFEGGDGL